jgi:hypothetical protein
MTMNSPGSSRRVVALLSTWIEIWTDPGPPNSSVNPFYSYTCHSLRSSWYRAFVIFLTLSE